MIFYITQRRAPGLQQNHTQLLCRLEHLRGELKVEKRPPWSKAALLGLLPWAATNTQVRNSIQKLSGLTISIDIVTWLHAIEKYFLFEKIESEADKIVFAINNIDYAIGNARDIVIHMEWLNVDSKKKDLISFFMCLKLTILRILGLLLHLDGTRKIFFSFRK